MKVLKICTSLLLIALISACKIPLAIDGYGRVQGTGYRTGNWYGVAGSNSMYFYNNDISGAYNQTWYARDRDGVGTGWDFVGWEGGCEDRQLNQACSVNVDAETIADLYGDRGATLEAVFGRVNTLQWSRPTQRENGQTLTLSQIDRYEITYSRQNSAGKMVEKVIEVNGNLNSYNYQIPIPRNVNRVTMVTVDTSNRRSATVNVNL